MGTPSSLYGTAPGDAAINRRLRSPQGPSLAGWIDSAQLEALRGVSRDG